jgi:hypothetical protein
MSRQRGGENQMRNQIEVYTDTLTDWIQGLNENIRPFNNRNEVKKYIASMNKNKRNLLFKNIKSKEEYIQLYKEKLDEERNRLNLLARRKANFERKLPMWQELNRQEKQRMREESYKEYLAELEAEEKRRREVLAAEAEARANAEAKAKANAEAAEAKAKANANALVADEAAALMKKKRTWTQRIRNAVTFKRRGGKRTLTRRNRNI